MSGWVEEPRTRRPANYKWISYDLLTQPKQFWSEFYPEELSDEDAIKILMNITRIGELLMPHANERVI